MIKTIGQVEASIRDSLIKIHKQLTGRGPKDVNVKYFNNMLFFKMENILTPLEEELLKVPQGEDIICELRSCLCKTALKQIKQEIKNITRKNVERITTKVLPQQNVQYGIIVLEQENKPCSFFTG